MSSVPWTLHVYKFVCYIYYVGFLLVQYRIFVIIAQYDFRLLLA